MIKFYAIPEWATHIAQNKTGAWIAYEKEPTLDSKYQVWMGGGKEERLEIVVNSTLLRIRR